MDFIWRLFFSTRDQQVGGLERALHNPSQGIRVLSSKIISLFLIKIKYIFVYFLTTTARLALALRKDVGRSDFLLKLQNRLKSFQHDYVVVDTHHRANARQTFVVKKHIVFILF